MMGQKRASVDSTGMGQQEQEYYELIGAINAISMLKEELELRLEEARDDCVREALDNAIALVGAQIIEYQHRRNELRKALRLETLNTSEM